MEKVQFLSLVLVSNQWFNSLACLEIKNEILKVASEDGAENINAYIGYIIAGLNKTQYVSLYTENATADLIEKLKKINHVETVEVDTMTPELFEYGMLSFEIYPKKEKEMLEFIDKKYVLFNTR